MILLTILLLFFPFLLLIRLLCWMIVVIWLKWKNYRMKYYGKFISYGDVCLDENFSGDTAVPRSSIVITMTLDASLTIDQLRKIFIKNVLKASKSSMKYKMRYPELQQYLSTLLGFRIWKQDPNFNIAHHIVEHVVPDDGDMSLSKIHSDMLNKPYHKQKSPWEIVLVQKPSVNQVVVACRFHHVLGDAISLLKLFVECLGQKPLKTAQATCDIILNSKANNCSICKTLIFYLLFPWNHMIHMLRVLYIFILSWNHPWKIKNYRRNKDSKSLVAWSSPLSLDDIKNVAKLKGVTGSAVIMELCTGAIRNCQEDVFGKKDIGVGIQLPKPGHPNILTNHVYLGIMKLPTSHPSPDKRLEKCHEIYQQARQSNLGLHLDLVGRVAGAIPYPFVNYCTVNRFIPIALTNIAGDEEGFAVGGTSGAENTKKLTCSDFRMTVGTFKGVLGVVFCASSYKGTLRIGVVANETVMELRQVEMLAENLHLELKALQEQ